MTEEQNNFGLSDALMEKFKNSKGFILIFKGADGGVGTSIHDMDIEEAICSLEILKMRLVNQFINSEKMETKNLH